MNARHRVHVFLLVASIAAMGITGCGDDGTGPTDTSPPRALSGSVTKGPVSGAIVEVTELHADGEIVPLPTSIQTNSMGRWETTLPEASSSPYRLDAIGGTYSDEKIHMPFALGEMLGFAADPGTGGDIIGQVTPLTHALYLTAQDKMNGGTAPADAFSEVLASIDGLGFDPSTTYPDKTGNSAERKYAALTGGFSWLIGELIQSYPELALARHFDLVLAVAEDMADGWLDGRNIGGEQIEVSVGTTIEALPALNPGGVDVLVDQANAYAQTVEDLIDTTVDPFQIIPSDFRFQVIVTDASGQPMPNLRISAWNELPCEVVVDCVGKGPLLRSAARRGETALPATTIRFVVDQESRVELGVYDMADGLVKTLIDTTLSSGPHAVVWDGRNDDDELMPAGIYRIHMQATDPQAPTTVHFDADTYGVLYTNDPEIDVCGYTASDGLYSESDESRFPVFIERGFQLMAVSQDCQPLGSFDYTGNVMIVVTDTLSSAQQAYERPLIDGLNRFHLVFSPLGSSASGASAEPLGVERGVQRSTAAAQAIWQLNPPCPNPFN